MEAQFSSVWLSSTLVTDKWSVLEVEREKNINKQIKSSDVITPNHDPKDFNITKLFSICPFYLLVNNCNH